MKYLIALLFPMAVLFVGWASGWDYSQRSTASGAIAFAAIFSYVLFLGFLADVEDI